MKELAKKLATKGVYDVLEQMTGDDIILNNEQVSKKDNLIVTYNMLYAEAKGK